MDYPEVIHPSEFDAINKDNRVNTSFEEFEKLSEQLKNATTQEDIDIIKRKLDDLKK